jgi:hypothetical protein
VRKGSAFPTSTHLITEARLSLASVNGEEGVNGKPEAFRTSNG